MHLATTTTSTLEEVSPLKILNSSSLSGRNPIDFQPSVIAEDNSNSTSSKNDFIMEVLLLTLNRRLFHHEKEIDKLSLPTIRFIVTSKLSLFLLSMFPSLMGKKCSVLFVASTISHSPFKGCRCCCCPTSGCSAVGGFFVVTFAVNFAFNVICTPGTNTLFEVFEISNPFPTRIPFTWIVIKNVCFVLPVVVAVHSRTQISPLCKYGPYPIVRPALTLIRFPL
mmetsp:Transcript_11477/g.12585  ORF Transcript_11477/g.12585 Transcript_11477/m.12585 type:complete len:223 (+) Transcript_11477:2052-2720(+)